jgi:hypothetical protein
LYPSSDIRKWILAILFLILFFNLHAQDINIGLKYGFGNSVYSRMVDDVKTNEYQFNKTAFIIEFSPYFGKIFICSGVEYKMNDLGKMISVPLTFRLAFYKKIRPFIEGGAYYNYILDSKDSYYSLTNDIGAKVGMGLLFYIGKRWRIESGYYNRFGFTGGLQEEILLPLEQVQIEDYRLREGSFEFCVKYRF